MYSGPLHFVHIGIYNTNPINPLSVTELFSLDHVSTFWTIP